MKRSLACLFLVSILSGCSVYMASQQPDKKNVDLFKVGTPRVQIIGEFGLPTVSDKAKNGKICEIFSFTQGYAKGSKAGRAVVHGVADVLTLGLWEVVGRPTETAFSGDQVAYQVCYDENNIVQEVIPLTEYKGK